MAGVVLILLVIFAAGPVAVMLGGACWSALVGQLLADDADRRRADTA